MERDDCLEALANIQATLELMAQATAESWNPPKRCWVAPDENIYDLAGTLADCFRGNDIRRVLRWIEFNVDDGPVRRIRLTTILRILRDEIRHIECGNPNDPFRWARESIDDAARRVADELQHVANYIGELIRLIEPNLTPTEARAKFCFERWQAGDSYKKINATLKRSDWESFDDDKHVRGPINTWSKRIGVEPRKGHPGRRTKA